MGEGKIRFAAAEDADAILDIYAPYILETAFTFECVVPAREEFSRRVAGILADFPYLVHEEGGAVSGYAYAARFSERAAYGYDVGTSIYVAKGRRGQGIGKRLYVHLLDILAAQGYYNAIGVVATPNPASEKMHAGLGFAKFGGRDCLGHKFGRWHGVAWYCKILRDYALPPMPIRNHREVGLEFGII